ncbi:hypothetical protein AGLY_004479 [Aphis glycines]|uniref:Uncharacterized protein n=1 Tax=Aphis glycines TaxID=307491 RepID=A0A6G0TYP8_APHGL|nr:hypothetical protein AGLY_004479 [Aphis glycines]
MHYLGHKIHYICKHILDCQSFLMQIEHQLLLLREGNFCFFDFKTELLEDVSLGCGSSCPSGAPLSPHSPIRSITSSWKDTLFSPTTGCTCLVLDRWWTIESGELVDINQLKRNFVLNLVYQTLIKLFINMLRFRVFSILQNYLRIFAILTYFIPNVLIYKHLMNISNSYLSNKLKAYNHIKKSILSKTGFAMSKKNNIYRRIAMLALIADTLSRVDKFCGFVLSYDAMLRTIN